MFANTINGSSLSEFSGRGFVLPFFAFCNGLYVIADPGFRGGGAGGGGINH